MLKKYLWLAALLIGLSALVTVHHLKNPNDSAAVSDGRNASIASGSSPSTEKSAGYSEWYTASWEVAFLVFGWPGGIGIWALLLTLYAIAEQAVETRKAAEATARQAEIAQKALVLQFRPKLIVRGGGIDSESIVFWITNSGGSKACMYQFSLQLFVHDAGEEFEPIADKRSEQIDAEVVFSPGETKVYTNRLDEPFLVALRQQIDTQKAIPSATFTRRFMCAGSIQYRDDLGINRMTVLMRHYDARLGKFVASESSDNDYAD